MISHMGNLKQTNSETEGRLVVAGGGRRVMGEAIKGYNLSVIR